MTGEYYRTSELAELPTLAVGQEADLKIDTGKVRIWLSRCGIVDGARWDNEVTVERFDGGKWVVVERYPGGPK